MVGPEDPLQICLKGIFVQEGSSGTRFDHSQIEIKTFPIPVLLYIYTGGLCCMGRHSILNCGKDSLWARRFAGVHGDGPLAEVVRGQRQFVLPTKFGIW